MKYLFYIICLILVAGCSSDNDMSFHNDMKEYQGIWRDSIRTNNDIYIEEIMIKDNSLNYILSNTLTHVVLDTFSGTIVIGSDNKIGWNGISPINNKTRQTYWDVLELSPYQMRLYSHIYGVRNYLKVYHPELEEENIKDKNQKIVRDTLSELLQYQVYLPLHRDNLIEDFGSYNRLSGNEDISYFTHHSLFNKLSFNINFENDSVYSYTLSVSDINSCISCIKSNFQRLRKVNTKTEYIDSDNLETSNHVVIIDSTTKQITFKPIKDYDYWPNLSYYIGKSLNSFMDVFKTRYLYKFHENNELGLNEYSFQAHSDGICTDIFVCVDSKNIIKQTGVCLINTYLSSRKTEAQKELDKISRLLRRKYFLERESIDENGNKVFYFYPIKQKEDSAYEIRLRLRQYKNGIAKLYQVTVNYIML